jgi:hypothetical protein
MLLGRRGDGWIGVSRRPVVMPTHQTYHRKTDRYGNEQEKTSRKRQQAKDDQHTGGKNVDQRIGRTGRPARHMRLHSSNVSACLISRLTSSPSFRRVSVSRNSSSTSLARALSIVYALKVGLVRRRPSVIVCFGCSAMPA